MKKTQSVFILFLAIAFTLLSPLWNLATLQADSSPQNYQLIIELKEGITSDKLIDTINQTTSCTSATILDTLDKTTLLINVTSQSGLADILSSISRTNLTNYAQPDYIITCQDTDSASSETANTNTPLVFDKTAVPNDPYIPYQWGLYNWGQAVGDYGTPNVDINIIPVWNNAKYLHEVVVGVLDSGIDISHIDLMDNIYQNPKEIPRNGIDDDKNGYIDDVNGWDFLNEDNTVFDSPSLDSHGTFVAGIIAASSNNNIGIAGIAKNVKILPLKVIQGSTGYTSTAIKAIKYAEKAGVDIVNCSWGTTEYNKALETAMKKSKMLFVCSVGNNGNDIAENPTYPACYSLKNNISVASFNNKGEFAPYSNYGKGIDIAAPGTLIMSTLPGNNYSLASGTSFSSPFITGVAALTKGYNYKLNGNQLKKIILENAVYNNNLLGKVDSCRQINAYNTISDKKVCLHKNRKFYSPV